MLNSLCWTKSVLKHTWRILVNNWFVWSSDLCSRVRPHYVEPWVLPWSRLRICNWILLAAKALLSFSKRKRCPFCMRKLNCLCNLLFITHWSLFWSWACSFCRFYFFDFSSSCTWRFSIVLSSHLLLVKCFLLFFGKLLLIEGVDFFKNCVNFFESFSCNCN